MLSRSIEQIKPDYDVVVVGSGYGGGVAASRLSRAGYSVCLLERGREFLPGDFPDTLEDIVREAQYHRDCTHIGSRTALFDIRMHDDISVVQGCGLGGTSLINANVSLQMDPRLFDDLRWPRDLVADSERLNACYTLARDMLKPEELPEHHENLKKFQAHKQSGAQVQSEPMFRHAEFSKTPINVNFEKHINHVGIEQRSCNLCGDCVSGCNHSAKNTVAMNYLPDAFNHGAEIFCEVSVQYLEKAGNKWRVYYYSAHFGRELFHAPPRFVEADKVVIAAGALGSTEIMLRSRAKGLTLSAKVGEGFSGNGDVLAFAYNNDQEIDGIGSGDKNPEETGLVGPCITSVIDCRGAHNLEDGFVLEEGSVPGALGPLLPPAFSAAAKIFGVDTDHGFRDYLAERSRNLLSLSRGPYKGAVDNTQTYLVMSHDGSGGRMRLADNELQIDWPGVGDRPRLKTYAEAMTAATKALGGTYLKNPLTNKLNKNNQVTVHPLGGCCMGEAAGSGVVNHKGQVFSQGEQVHPGLYVMDGSIMPRSLGVNPLLTITALAERACHYLVKEDKNADIPVAAQPPEKPLMKFGDAVGIRFTEKMAGYFAKGDLDYGSAYQKGKADRENGPFEFVLTVISRDADEMLENPEHRARIFGTFVAPALSSRPLTATDGSFQLFVADENDPKTCYMRYNMTLHAEEGEVYQFEGHKIVRDEAGFDVWSDTTTLFITVTDTNGQLVGRGILKIAPQDFIKQLTTIRAFNGPGFAENAKAVVDFTKFFLSKVSSTYL